MNKLPYYGSRFVCGTAEAPAMGVTWYAQEDGTVCAEVTLTIAQQGPPGLVHGGATATLLDEAMGGAVFLAGYRVASVNLNINHHKPVPLGQPFTVTAQVKEVKGKKITASAELRLGDETLAVSGTGLYVQAPQLYQGLDAIASRTWKDEVGESQETEQ